MTTSSRQWFVVQTRPNSERRALANLKRQGFEVYFPAYSKRRSHAGKIDMVTAPLFPRYLFVTVDMVCQRWRSIYSTIGVARLVSNGEDPIPVADAVVEGLKSREDARGFVRLEQRPQFVPGDKIRVLDGVFADCLGLFDGMKDSERVAVLLDLLGRKVRLVLDEFSVAAA